MENLKATTPFLVANGDKYEIHDYQFDADGRRWEITTAGPFSDESEAVSFLESLT